MYVTYISQVQQLESILCTRDENQSSIQQSVTELGQKLGRAEQENKTLREQLQASSRSEQVNICQGSTFPASGKIMETWKMKKTFSRPGKIMEFGKSPKNLEKSWNLKKSTWKNHGFFSVI